MADVDEILAERGKTHGPFSMNANVSQRLKDVFKKCHPHWENLSNVHKEALEVMALKISRILSGQAGFKDHWDDIGGYAKLAGEDCVNYDRLKEYKYLVDQEIMAEAVKRFQGLQASAPPVEIGAAVGRDWSPPNTKAQEWSGGETGFPSSYGTRVRFRRPDGSVFEFIDQNGIVVLGGNGDPVNGFEATARYGGNAYYIRNECVKRGYVLLEEGK